jgi:hypothetical protein
VRRNQRTCITWRRRDRRGLEIGPTLYLEFDAATVEEFSRAANVTVYPVETGAVLSDHYQPQPRFITLEGVVSDTPAEFYIPKPGKQNRAPPPLVTPLILANAVLTATRQRANRVAAFFQTIDGLMDSRTPVTVTMLDGLEFANMMIVNHRAPRVGGSGGAVTMTLDMQEVVTADPAETVAAAQEREEPAVQQKRSRSRVAPKPPGSKELPTLDNLANQGYSIRP